MDANEMQELFEQASSYENIHIQPNEMTPLERFLNTMAFKPVDRIIDSEFGYWNDTLRRWHSEGLPKEVNSNKKADVFFGFDQWSRGIPFKGRILPAFEEEIVEQTERHTIKYDGNRVKCKVFTDGTDTIPHYMDFPIKDRASYLPFKERFLPKLHERIPHNIAEIAAAVQERNYVLVVFMGSTAGWIRDYMGFEGFSIGLCMQPELIEEILDDFRILFTEVARALVKHVEIDLVLWWEDIAFKTGPIVPPDFFYNKCGPVYKATMDIFRAHGTKHSYVDCDGDNRLLVPTWLDNGVDIVFPLEVNAGIHPETLRQKYPGVRMMGGVDKTVLLKGKSEIKKELQRLKPLVEEGGFIPHVDHRVQADVSYSDYLYYLECKRDLFGLPGKVLEVDPAVSLFRTVA